MPCPKRQSGRTLKKQVLGLLGSQDIEAAVDALLEFSPRQVVNPLFSFLNHKNQHIRWAAVVAEGAVISNLAEQDLEGARIIMRRIMWNLNDESGGIGWGLPEVMGETLARHGILADEFSPILLSYASEGGNFLEHEGLQRGLLWGIGRLSQERPELVVHVIHHLLRYLESSDAGVRGHAAWVIGILRIPEARSYLERLREDTSEFQFFSNQLVTRQVRETAIEALEAMIP